MKDVAFDQLGPATIDLTRPTCLFRKGTHSVFWLGITDDTAFRCNTYLIVDDNEAVITDPGSRAFFQQVWNRVAQILPPTRVRGMVISHQDPDIAASMVDWLEHVPDCEVLTSPRANVLLPHYGQPDYRYFDISAQPYQLASGRELQFIESPFLHFPGAFTTYDPVARCLFSSDIWAALDVDWKLVVEDFDDHAMKMNLFHMGLHGLQPRRARLRAAPGRSGDRRHPTPARLDYRPGACRRRHRVPRRATLRN
jgi:flavorubredoxin